MATPLTYSELYTALVAEGLTVVKERGSRKRCRCHLLSHQRGGRTIRPWGPVYGTMVHITAGNLGRRTVAQYIRDIINGDRVTPTKAQLVVAPDGTVHLNSAGRCNHAGKIGAAALSATRAGRWSRRLTWQDKRGSSVDGNTHFLGIECIAARAMTAAQRKACVLICAAHARAQGWDGNESVGHGECSSARSKADPNLDMGAFRSDVMARVKTKPNHG
jgi:hypothetical protein